MNFTSEKTTIANVAGNGWKETKQHHTIKRLKGLVGMIYWKT
jgi:hypothetical protein